jgi:hypothetical protein
MKTKAVKVTTNLLDEAEKEGEKLGVRPSQVIDAGVIAFREQPFKEKLRLVREAFKERQSATVTASPS